MALKKEITAQIKEVLSKNPQGLSITEIVSEVNINRNTAGRYLENLLVSGQVEMRHFGMAKIYALSQRVPLSAVLSISSELVIQLDGNLRVIFANEPFLALIGIDAKSLFGKNIEYTPVATFFDDSFSGFVRNIREGVAGKEWTGEIFLTTQDLFFFCRIAPTVFDDGRKGVSVLLQDITKRKLDEKKVEESERQFRLLAENSLDMISRTKPDGSRIYVSPAYKTTLGYEPEELLGKKEILIHPDDAHVLESFWNTLTQQNSSGTIIFRTKHKDGHYIWIESKIKAIFDEKTRQLSEYYTVTRDISERKRAEMALQKSEEQYRSLFFGMSEGILVADMETQHILHANPAMCRFLGRSEKELITKYTADIHPKENLDIVLDEFAALACGNKMRVKDIPLVRKDGTIVYADISASAVFIEERLCNVGFFTDVTERKKNELIRIESENRYRTIFENTGTATVLIEKNTIIGLVNAEFESLSGFSKHEIEGKMSWTEFVVKEDLERMMSQHRMRMEGQKSALKNYEFRFVTKTGEIRHIFLTIDIIPGTSKSIASLLDITERKFAENSLRESEDKYRKLVEISPDAVILHCDGKIIFVNPAAISLLGASHPSEIIGKSVNDLIHPEFRDDIRKTIENDLKDAITPTKELPLLRIDGTVILVEGRGVKTFIDGKPAVQVAIRDITDRRQAKKSLRESEEKYRTLIDRASDGICVIQDDIVKMCNRYITEFWGGTVEEILGRPFTDFIHPDALLEVIERYKRRMAGEKLLPIYETILKRKDGSRFYAELNAGIVSYEGKPANLIIIRDINNRKKTEGVLREIEDRYRTLAEASNDLIFVIGRDDRVEYANSFAATILKKPAEQIIGSPRTSLFPAEVAGNQKKGLDYVFETGVPFRSEGALTLSNRMYWFDHLLTPLKDTDGHVRSVLGISRDITERKNAETQLQNSEQRFMRLLEMSFDAIAIHKNKKITFLNDKAVKILGAASPRDLVGRSILDFVHPDSRRDVEERVRKISSNHGAPLPLIPEKFLRVDGTTVNVEVMAIGFEENGISAVQVAFRESASWETK